MSFFFAKRALKAATNGGYVICSVPTNLANWGLEHPIGNITGCNAGEQEIGVYFTRTNPLEGTGIILDEEGYAEIDLATRAELTSKLETMAVREIIGTSSLLGMTWDFMSFDDLNWVTVVTSGASTDLDVQIYLAEQVLPIPTYTEGSIQ